MDQMDSVKSNVNPILAALLITLSPKFTGRKSGYGTKFYIMLSYSLLSQMFMLCITTHLPIAAEAHDTCASQHNHSKSGNYGGKKSLVENRHC